MAAPSATASDLLTLIHASAPGTTSGGWTLNTKTLRPTSGRFKIWDVAVTGPGNRAYTGYYTEQADGSLGKLRRIIDSNGVGYRWSGAAWVTAGS